MAIITQFPRGLVSLTGLRDMGEAPRELADSIAPTIDITQFLLLNRESIFGTVSASAIGSYVATGNVHRVPPGELWYVHAFSVGVTVFAGDTARIVTAFSDQGQVISSGLPNGLAAAAGANQSLHVRQDAPAWIGPGVELACIVEAYTGAAGLGLGLRASITRLKI
jgi:hypothetical protein